MESSFFSISDSLKLKDGEHELPWAHQNNRTVDPLDPHNKFYFSANLWIARVGLMWDSLRTTFQQVLTHKPQHLIWDKY